MLVRERLALVARRAFVRLLLVERVLPVERRVELVLRRAVLRLVLRLLFWVAICGESLLRDVSFT